MDNFFTATQELLWTWHTFVLKQTTNKWGCYCSRWPALITSVCLLAVQMQTAEKPLNVCSTQGSSPVSSSSQWAPRTVGFKGTYTDWKSPSKCPKRCCTPCVMFVHWWSACTLVCVNSNLYITSTHHFSGSQMHKCSLTHIKYTNSHIHTQLALGSVKAGCVFKFMFFLKHFKGNKKLWLDAQPQTDCMLGSDQTTDREMSVPHAWLCV